jgi:acetoin:2,6-dichlorophenolindophenol oxidoreductase subunit alpha
MPLTKKELIELYRWLVLTRNFELRVNDLFRQRGVPEIQHSSVGEEAIGVGAVYGLRREDVIIPSLRCRGAFLVKGVPPKVIMAAMFGKYTEACGGKNTSHHLGDLDLGIIAGSGVIGASIPLATGAALACKLKKQGNVALSFFGDGSTNTGNFHEAVNMAAVLKLPIVFICENNMYGMSMPVERVVCAESIACRASAYGIPGVRIDGNDVQAVYETVQEAVERARGATPQPTLVECQTYRWHGHSEGDPPDAVYRSQEEIEEMKKNCPVERFREKLRNDGILTEDMIQNIDREVQADVDAAVKFADEAPYPEVKNMFEDVYAPVSEEVQR